MHAAITSPARRIVACLWRLCLLACLVAPLNAAYANDLVVGAPAPPIALHTLDGKTIDLQALRGKVVIVTFWATWCEPCREELPLLSRYAREHADQGLVVLGFSLDAPEDLDKVRAVAGKLEFPVGLLGDPHVPGYGRIWRLPVSFTIDRSGRLVEDGWKERPPEWTAKRLERVVTPLLER
ncbi:TlpA family protein disulfide reductase [Dyella solisilvae]|uniref:TlpA family protein disulfide reductase n=1 Tax=Dyella solisilvae TaxID=1920168 RepID=A0A370K3X3_9GAMM|nr:TlpA disulfide reductase family protein [Dyella solisilvae]RDI97363.1 TlpA family protein disulfide reductase [Dyella solisilvae]